VRLTIALVAAWRGDPLLHDGNGRQRHRLAPVLFQRPERRAQALVAFVNPRPNGSEVTAIQQNQPWDERGRTQVRQDVQRHVRAGDRSQKNHARHDSRGESGHDYFPL
jgi:hypothetical protein